MYRYIFTCLWCLAWKPPKYRIHFWRCKFKYLCSISQKIFLTILMHHSRKGSGEINIVPFRLPGKPNSEPAWAPAGPPLSARFPPSVHLWLLWKTQRSVVACWKLPVNVLLSQSPNWSLYLHCAWFMEPHLRRGFTFGKAVPSEDKRLGLHLRWMKSVDQSHWSSWQHLTNKKALKEENRDRELLTDDLCLTLYSAHKETLVCFSAAESHEQQDASSYVNLTNYLHMVSQL